MGTWVPHLQAHNHSEATPPPFKLALSVEEILVAKSLSEDALMAFPSCGTHWALASILAAFLVAVIHTRESERS